MPINLHPLSTEHPQWIEEQEYQRLVQRVGDGGWSQCASEQEWLAKLHYLREGLRAGKLTEPQFLERETRLVQGWLRIP
jgi:hypothetical protein